MAGELDWQSNSGNALCVIQNPQGSGKRITIRSFEAFNQTAINAAALGSAAGQYPNLLRLSTVSQVGGGDPVPLTKMDSAAPDWPSTVRVVKGAAHTSPASVRQIAVTKQANPATLAWGARSTARGRGLSGGPWSAIRRGPANNAQGATVRGYVPVDQTNTAALNLNRATCARSVGDVIVVIEQHVSSFPTMVTAAPITAGTYTQVGSTYTELINDVDFGNNYFHTRVSRRTVTGQEAASLNFATSDGLGAVYAIILRGVNPTSIAFNTDVIAAATTGTTPSSSGVAGGLHIVDFMAWGDGDGYNPFSATPAGFTTGMNHGIDFSATAWTGHRNVTSTGATGGASATWFSNGPAQLTSIVASPAAASLIPSGADTLVLRPGEAVALHVPTAAAATVSRMPLRVSATLVRVGNATTGVPNRTFTASYFVNVGPPDTGLLTIANTAGSGEVVALAELSIEEVGTYDSPSFQLVPVGSINSDALGDPTRVVPLIKMDSLSPTPASSTLRVLQDVAILPAGMPENAIADSSTGSPKGVNYLKTKDFLGPVFRTLFPEVEGTNNHAAPSATQVMDNLGHVGHVAADLLFRRAGIVLNEGEAIALVSAAETAVLSTAVGVSGWSSWSFGAQIDVESRFAPVLTLTGLKTGSEVRVFRTSDDVELAGIESSGTTFTYGYEWDGADTGVYIVVHALGWLPVRYSGQTLTSAGLTLLVQQTVDRQYAN
jgi:hypothetical protein